MHKGTKNTNWLNGKITELLILVAALAFAAPRQAQAYVYFFTNNDFSQGTLQHWNTGPLGDFPIPYWVHDAGFIDGTSFYLVEQALDNSFKTWENISSASVTFTDKGYTDQRSINRQNDDGINLIIFDTQTTDFTVTTDIGPSVVAITINKFSPSDGHLLDSDIIFNDQEYVFSTTQATNIATKLINLQDVATHEIGHMLGLDHTWIEHATMYPYARDGQNSVEDDDKAAISNLYPVPAFETSFDSLRGRIYNVDEQPVTGVYVSAIDGSTRMEAVAALSDTNGFYHIRGLRPGNYYLRARSVDLKHVGSYIVNTSDPTAYIPQYYSGASLLDAAEPIATGGFQPDYDFTLTTATLLARYDMSKPTQTILNFSTKTGYYLAVRFPVSSLPEAFKVHGLTFFNNDLNMAWPSIMLTSGSEFSPAIDNPIRMVENYVGAEQSVTNVEWEAVQLTNASTLWVVLQFPDQQFVGIGDGPGLGATDDTGFNDMFYSTSGASFVPSTFDSSYDLALYLTVEITGAAIVPSMVLDLNGIDFGKAAVGRPTVLSYPLKNDGLAALTIEGLHFTPPRYTANIGGKTLPTAIAPGVTDTLNVVFSPTRASTYSGTFTIMTNDPVREQIQMAITGTGAYPVAQLATSELTFGTVEAGSADTASFSISSTGEVPLRAWGWSIDGSGFKVLSPDTLEIPAAGSADVSVRFAPFESGAHSSTLSFTTDDEGSTLHQIALSGTATGGGVVLRCDMTGDGAADIVDLLYFLLLSRRSPDDPRLDWDGSGGFSMTDVLALLMDIRGGTCPDVTSSTMLAAQGEHDGNELLGTLSAEEISWLREQAEKLGLSEQDFEQALAVLAGAGAGRITLPASFSLAQNRPNPFNPSTAISYSVPQGEGASAVSLKVYSIGGRLVRVLADGPATPGEHTVFWDGSDQRGRKVSSGVYIYRLKAGGRALTRKMVLLK
jgi:hypothetical protein